MPGAPSPAHRAYTLKCEEPDVQGLAFNQIVGVGVERLRTEYRDVPDPRVRLEEPVTLLGLQRLHEAVFGRDLPKDSFRRGMQLELRETGRNQAGVVGKPARLVDPAAGCP